MKELSQVRQAVLDALNGAGVPAVAAYPTGGVRTYDGAVAAVAVGAAESRSLGFCGYLGEVYDEAAGTVREVYGKQLEGAITVDLRAERAEDCETGCQQAAEVLLGELPSGIRPLELRWEALAWEKATGLFLRRGELQCRAVFVAERQEDGETFLDFRLKGVMEHE